MANRLTRITTRTGDDGTTGLGDGRRVDKGDLRIEALGDVDSLNSLLGVVLSQPVSAGLRDILVSVQNDLFDLGAEVCIPGHVVLSEDHLARLESHVSSLNSTLPPLKEFILPAGCAAASHTHVARAACRRAERSLVRLHRAEALPGIGLAYLNRLSDLLFIVSRVMNRDAGVAEACWQPSARRATAA
jgi:cob(I)alamin adenosyltransferase